MTKKKAAKLQKYKAEYYSAHNRTKIVTMRNCLFFDIGDVVDGYIVVGVSAKLMADNNILIKLKLKK
jgi:hypothetical protein